MNEYERTHKHIAELKERKAQIEKQIMELENDLAVIENEIGECEGYLLELDYLDNGSQLLRN